MILTESEHEEVLTIGNVETRVSSIPLESMAFVFDLVSTKFYSEPIKSIVRELTSNSYDANVESGSDVPVIINLGFNHENSNYYIEFCDNGVGLSEQRMTDIYMNWFTSTKRESNDMIGGFGIGSKSFFSYTDYANITTVNDGFKYEYLFYKNGKLPTLDTLSKVESDEKSGTKVKIEIRSLSDKEQFYGACRTELFYFDNVWVNSSGFNNDYKIYEGENFRFRDGKNKLHVVIGNVTYPLSFDLVGIELNHQFMNIALKFNIGELEITPNREHLQYTDKTINAIKNKFSACRKELGEIHARQNQPVDDLFEFYRKINESPRIYVDENVYFSIPYFFVTEILKYKPFIDLYINKNVFLNWKTMKLSGGRLSKRSETFDPCNLKNVIYVPDKTDNRNNLYHSNATLLFETDLSEKSSKKNSYVNWKSFLRLNTKDKKHVLNKGQIILSWKKHVREYLKTHTKSYNVVTKQWIEEYNQQNRVKHVVNKEVVRVKRFGDFSYSEIKVEELEKRLLVFCYGKDEECARLITLVEKWKGYKKCIAIEINKTNLYKIKHLKNLVDCEFLMDVPMLQNYYQKVALANSFTKYFHRPSIRISNYYQNIKKELCSFSSQYSQVNFPEITIDENKFYHLLSKKKELDDFYKKTECLSYLSEGCPIKYVKLFVKTLHLKLINDEYRS